jgi:hypothetical protein
MYRIIIILCILILFGCNGNEKKISDFTSDGCTLFPDSSLILKKDWCECCFEHDIAYWQGGTEDERLKADEELRECVLEKTGDENLARVIYKGVRFGGSPYFYNWYRWGYGWDYKRKYKKLTEDEKKQVESKLKEYYSSNSERPCK